MESRHLEELVVVAEIGQVNLDQEIGWVMDELEDLMTKMMMKGN